MVLPFGSPPALALARPMSELPGETVLPGGTKYEPKWDGFRTAICVDGGAVIWSRQGKDLTRSFPDLRAAADEQIPDGCVVDGEAVVWIDGRLSFDALQRRLGLGASTAARLARAEPASFVAFDVLAVAGTDARDLPFSERRALLEELARGWRPPLNLSPVTSALAEARVWLDEMPAVGVEGIVAKGAAQLYVGGRRDWVKVKRRDTVDVVIGAVIGSRVRPEALIVGAIEGGRLRVVGRSAPLKPAAARQIGELLRPPKGEHPWPTSMRGSAIDRFNASRDPVQVTLVEPIVAEVSADVAMSGSSFRHLVRFVRLRPDLAVDDVEWPGDR